MAKVYAIISGKGGTGKTTSTINLGTAMNHLGEDVTILDGNITTPNIGIHLGAPIVPVTLNHVLRGQAKIEDAIYEHESGTKVIPSSLSLKETEKVDIRKLPELTKKLRKITNNLLIDSAAGLGEEARAAIESADEIIIVTNPEIAAVTDALKTMKVAEEIDRPIKGVIIARYRGRNTEMPIPSIKEMLETPILGIIPEDEAIKRSQVIKNAVIYTHPKSPSARAYMDTTKRILGDNFGSFEPPIRLGVISSLLSRLGFR